MQYFILMEIRWSEEKNELLKRSRGVSFEDAKTEIEAGRVLAVVDHPTRPVQRIFVVRLGGYVHNVPFVVEKDGSLFLKTIYATRKGQKYFQGGS
jgi:uncharacterized DUF497 family protein